jgi:hypothetical protein
MSRSSTPERIDQAHLAAVRANLMSDGATEDSADAWIAAWEAKAAEDGLVRGQAYWRRPAWTGRGRKGAQGQALASGCGGEWRSAEAIDQPSAVEATRAAVAEWLGVAPGAFDVEF